MAPSAERSISWRQTQQEGRSPPSYPYSWCCSPLPGQTLTTKLGIWRFNIGAPAPQPDQHWCPIYLRRPHWKPQWWRSVLCAIVVWPHLCVPHQSQCIHMWLPIIPHHFGLRVFGSCTATLLQMIWATSDRKAFYSTQPPITTPNHFHEHHSPFFWTPKPTKPQSARYGLHFYHHNQAWESHFTHTPSTSIPLLWDTPSTQPHGGCSPLWGCAGPGPSKMGQDYTKHKIQMVGTEWHTGPYGCWDKVKSFEPEHGPIWRGEKSGKKVKVDPKKPSKCTAASLTVSSSCR